MSQDTPGGGAVDPTAAEHDVNPPVVPDAASPDPLVERPSGERTWGFRTRSLHAGGTPDSATGARAVPIYQSTSFVFEDTTDAANLFSLQKYGNIYSRIGNPTVAAFEERIASLEGGIGAVATASGMSAEFVTFAALAGAGDHVVASSQLYGGTVTLLDVTLRRFGVETTFVGGTDPADYAAAIRPEDQGRLRRGRREPLRRDRRPGRARRGRPRGRRAARRRRDPLAALPGAADRARRRHRHPLGDEVPRRPRDHPGRRRRRERPLRLGQRAASRR